MKVLSIMVKGGNTLCIPLNEIQSFFEDDDEFNGEYYNVYEVRVKNMTKKEFDELKEFEGF